jgi:outer membrane protein TolC
MKRFIILLILLSTFPIFGQEAITLEECYALATANYPLAKQTELLAKQNQLDQEVIATGKLPQFMLDAQATYQSDVIEVPIPNTNIQPLNNDQYRANLSVNQLIYNAGATDAAANLKLAQLKTKEHQVLVNLYQLKQKVNQLYFSVLQAQETNVLLQAKKAQLQAKLSEVSAGIKYGIILPASDKVLKAEILKLNQQIIAVKINKESVISALSSLLYEPLSTTILFQNSNIETNFDSKLNRPELALFNYKKEEILQSEIVRSKQNSPKIVGFATAGYGNPGLNMLDNSFQAFYITGIKLNWNVFDWNSNKKQQASLAIHKDIIETEKEVFTLNTRIDLNQQQKEIEKIEAFILLDIEMIELRKEVLKSADSQLKNGVITSSAYITELTNLYEDENSLVQHKIQLQLAKATYNVILGQ